MRGSRVAGTTLKDKFASHLLTRDDQAYLRKVARDQDAALSEKIETGSDSDRRGQRKEGICATTEQLATTVGAGIWHG
jgi:hypothetical protein